ncbi:MAG: hypothetical protein R3F17_05555 [Planctomycetota bacterium]
MEEHRSPEPQTVALAWSNRSKRDLWLLGVGALTLWVAWIVREVLNPLVLAYMLAFIVHPLVRKLEGMGWSRAKAVNVIYLVAGTLGLVMALGFGSQGANLFGKVLRQAQDQQDGLFINLDRRFSAFVEANRHRSWMAWIVEETGADQQAEGDAVPGSDGAPATGSAGPEAPGAEGADAAAQGTDAGTTGGGDAAGQPGIDLEPDGAAPGEAAGATEEDAARRPGDGQPWIAVDDHGDVHLLPTLQRVWNQVVLDLDPALAGSAARRGVNLMRSWFGSLLGLVGMLVLLPIYTWFLLFELERIHSAVRQYLPVRDRARYLEVARRSARCSPASCADNSWCACSKAW